MLKNIVENGLGIGITPSLAIDEKIDKKLVVKIVEEIHSIPNKVYVQYRENSAIAKPIKKIIYSIINHELQKTIVNKN